MARAPCRARAAAAARAVPVRAYGTPAWEAAFRRAASAAEAEAPAPRRTPPRRAARDRLARAIVQACERERRRRRSDDRARQIAVRLRRHAAAPGERERARRALAPRRARAAHEAARVDEGARQLRDAAGDVVLGRDDLDRAGRAERRRGHQQRARAGEEVVADDRDVAAL